MGQRRRSTSIEERLYTFVTLAAALISLAFLLVGLAFRYWPVSLVLAAASALVYGVCFGLTTRAGQFRSTAPVFAIYTVLLMVALWFTVGGFYSDTPIFLLSALVVLIVVSPTPRMQRLSMAGLGLVYLAFVIVQYAAPQLVINVPDRDSLILGNAISTGLMGLAVGFMVRMFKRNYDRDRFMVRDAMRELNHRVKNNLALVSSLISLQDQELGDRADLSELRNEVQTIISMHTKLQEHDTVSEVELGPYLGDVLTSIFSGGGRRMVRVQNAVPAIPVSSRVAVVLGLIVNEIAVNSLKHGYGDVADARFRLEGGLEPDGSLVLTSSENGPAFPEDISLRNPGSHGLQIISGLAEQIGGSLTLIRHPHPVFRIRTPEPR